MVNAFGAPFMVHELRRRIEQPEGCFLGSC